MEGRTVAWRRLGDPALPPLLLLNGYAATSLDWDPAFLDRLGEGWDVIAPDNRGMGGSDLGEGELTIAGMADDAIAVLDALGLERAAVAGWSMGGFVAQELAAGAPQRVSSLALMATDPGAEAERASPEVWAELTDHGGDPTEQARRLLGLLFPPDFARAIFEQFGDVVAAARAALDPAALDAQERAMEAWHEAPGLDRLEEIALPSVVITGELDRVIPPGNAELLAGAIPGAGSHALSGCGHALMAQQPARAAELIAGLRDRA